MNKWMKERCNKDIEALEAAVKEMDDVQLRDMLLDAGVDIPQHLVGVTRCCGNVVYEGERCPTCGDLND